ncbi:stress protein, partial [Pseudoalteromonas aliena]
KDYAQQMRKQIFDFKAQHQQEIQNTEQSQTDTLENSLSISKKEIAKFGLMSNMAIFAIAALAPFINIIVNFLEKQIIAKVEG